jgi:hypothetical protein
VHANLFPCTKADLTNGVDDAASTKLLVVPLFIHDDLQPDIPWRMVASSWVFSCRFVDMNAKEGVPMLVTEALNPLPKRVVGIMREKPRGLAWGNQGFGGSDDRKYNPVLSK